jgi:hypothetical protein
LVFFEGFGFLRGFWFPSRGVVFIQTIGFLGEVLYSSRGLWIESIHTLVKG